VLHIDNIAGNVFSTGLRGEHAHTRKSVAPKPSRCGASRCKSVPAVPVVFCTTAGAGATPAVRGEAHWRCSSTRRRPFDANEPGRRAEDRQCARGHLVHVRGLRSNGKVQASDVEALSAGIATRIDGIKTTTSSRR
jgi:hypothetical protein